MNTTERLSGETLKLIVSFRERQPVAAMPPQLDKLFNRLHDSGPIEGEEIESAIWREWMSHNDPEAAEALQEATDSIITEDYDEAEELLNKLIARRPDYAEAWNKRATLYYMQDRDDDSLADLRQVLALEPRHFGAMCHIAQIYLARGDRETALYALDTALRLNPHLDDARATARKLLKDTKRSLQ